MNMIPSNEHFKSWINQYVPEKDLFFIKEEDLFILELYLTEVLIIPKNEFYEHSSYNYIQLVNSYEYWNIDDDIQFVIVAEPDWFNKLPNEKKKILNARQVDINRGLVLPLPSLPESISLIENHIVIKNDQVYIVLQSQMWTSLTEQLKAEFLKEYAQEWDSWDGCVVPPTAPIHIKNFANTFPHSAGSNCLSATLYAVTQQEWMIHEWVHQKTFEEGIKRAGYYIHDGAFQETDIVAWVNAEGVIQHASYCLGDNLFFNKNGQTFFNPWKIVEWSKLNEEWQRFTTRIYRRNKQL
ncbi:hypothetical protein [Psychrobacillus sp. MER TA 171]|uniref:hypothetical protein n=1 Tax=Psychrobacillus sp. MER TA 171 TaxID=2939577 RepID=UPI0020405E7F|nr:hypothetical protein [Psychrobacillus sp. MER TA 171]MCM3356821.1 hypothetical protein [Psychrobacillus sp. MER TA 171]